MEKQKGAWTNPKLEQGAWKKKPKAEKNVVAQKMPKYWKKGAWTKPKAWRRCLGKKAQSFVF